MARDILILEHMYTDMSVWFCKQCNYSTKNKRNVMEHIESKHIEFGEDYVCNLCGKTAKTRKALRRHNERNHPKYSSVTITS